MAGDESIYSGNKDNTEGIENWDEYGIVQEMISEVKSNNDFMHIQKLAYKARENISGDPIFFKGLLPNEDIQNKSLGVQKALIKFQTGFIEKWK